ncbi:MAG: tetratricopeptide repeat protein [Pseudomonadota bacterium]
MHKRVYRQTSAKIAFSLACGIVLSACATDPTTTGSIQTNGKSLEQMSVIELNQTASSLGRQYDRKPNDRNIGLAYANVLRMTGRNEQSLAVIQQMVIKHPEDNAILSAYGKALASTGNLKKALKVIERAQRPDRPDWRLYSAQGAILDQLGQSKQARIQYQKALDIVPNEPSVLSNMGMSYVLTGDVRGAETYLRRAIRQPGADSRVRQNLALVVGLQGNFDEAEKIATSELPPAEARANIKFLREMLAQQSAWNLLKNTEKADKKQTN